MRGTLRRVKASGIWVVALFVLAILGVVLAGDILPTLGMGPILNVPPSVEEGGRLTGDATDNDPPIVVEATLNGITPLGPPDTSSSGGVNDFGFDVPDGTAGGTITVRATNGSGHTTVKTVTITPRAGS